MKYFFDVLPNLKLNTLEKQLFNQVKVIRVVVNSAKTRMWIYILSERCISKQQIYDVQKEIYNQYFNGVDIEINIIEKFELSNLYTIENFYKEYKESILLELKEKSPIESILFKSSNLELTEDFVKLSLPNSVLGKTLGDNLVKYLQKVFCIRAGFEVEIKSDYSGSVFKTFSKESLLQVQKEALKVQKNAKIGEEKVELKKAKEKESSLIIQSVKKDNVEDLIYGRNFDEASISISEIVEGIGEVSVTGEVLYTETIPIRNEKVIFIFSITDFTDTINVKLFLHKASLNEVSTEIKKGSCIKIKGYVNLDSYDKELNLTKIFGIKKAGSIRTKREDNSKDKRVELHCHTKMSDMDGVTDAKVLVKRAYDWGHKAIAITDHGVVQSFPEANHCFDAWGGCVPKESDFKVLYGMEAYIVDDLKTIATNTKNQNLDNTYVVFDLETTGFSPISCNIIEIGAVKIKDNKVIDSFSTFVNPKEPIPFRIEELTKINDSMVEDAPTIEVVLPKFLDFCKGCVMVAHNADFDMSFIKANCKKLGYDQDYTYIDTVALARYLLPQNKKYKLDVLAKTLNIPLLSHHRAVDDARCTGDIFIKLMEMVMEKNINSLEELNEKGKCDEEAIKKMPTHHCIILVQNEIGRINLYKLVSQSHLKYFKRFPRVPKSLINKHREGLLLGTACVAGELYDSMLRGAAPEEINRIVNYYDYLEIQPLSNNSFLIDSDRHSNINSEEDIININKQIVKLGEDFNKPVCATCDVHYIDPEDSIYRKIIMASKGFKDEEDLLYFRTTEEMLKEFSYLGMEKAREVVITNTNLIADKIEKISPIHPDKFPPVIPNSDKDLRDICYNKAHELYGDELPEIVEKRLERELNSIISNGYAVMYIIAQKLVWKSNEDGYLVGSRGSVGSSFAATMSGITEVNPLPPHYLCPKCKHSDFTCQEAKDFAGMAGCDMPDKICPVCGEKMNKDGFDIPFETFLGFNGDKEPDIDLNFSGEYQARAHKYTEVIFGKGQTFKAGTIGTIAEKTAFGLVKKYFEERDIIKRNCEIDRIKTGCTGVRRSTGQHPGGIIVLPKGEEIEKFTPVQHPANDTETDIITTHFDYHSIDGNLLKLDILGHDDPTVIRFLEDLTGIKATTIPLDDREVMSLFENTKALGITPKAISGCELGCLGLPEFGTDFAMQMLKDTKPKYVSDLVRIAGLAHGTDVWLGNAQKLIKEGIATISTAICTRDDIMTYLIAQGVESDMAFKIMESVRKGKGLRDEWETLMKDKGVPEWYIWSCKMIKYMFPKAHAAAYVMMAFRIAWYKVHYKEAFYCAYFSIRANAFSYEFMCLGQEKLESKMAEIKAKGDEITNKEKDMYSDMRVVQEMYARGIKFLPIDIYKAKAHRFQVIDGKIMPSIDAIDGMGEKSSECLERSAKEGAFSSLEDVRKRAQVNQTTIETMVRLHLLEGLPETDQLSIFD